jgi:hypothetical protein
VKHRRIAANLFTLLVMVVATAGVSSAKNWDADPSLSQLSTPSPVEASSLRQKVAPPSFTKPSSGDTVNGTLTVAGSASRNAAKVALAIDSGSYRVATGTTKWSETVDTTTLTNGSHTLTAMSTNSLGASATATISVVIANAPPDTTPPNVAVTNPVPNAVLSGPLTVTGTATDDRAVARIEVTVDGSGFTAAQGTTSWTYPLDPTTLSSGSHTLTVRATDTAGNTATADVDFSTNPPTPSVAPTTTTPILSTAPLWFAGMEGGSLDEWNNGGGEFDSGGGDSVASQDVAHSGSWSVKQTINTTGGSSSGTRMFRWAELRTLKPGQAARISVWVYIPKPVQITGYFNLFQNKSHTQDDSYIDVFWQVNLRSRSDGSLYLNAAWGCGAENPSFPLGPFATSTNLCNYQQPLQNIDFPVAKWVKLTEEITPSSTYTGTFKFWQDDTLLYDYEGNVLTGYPNTRDSNGVDDEFAVNAYSNGTNPAAYTQYVDDASITPLP